MNLENGGLLVITHFPCNGFIYTTLKICMSNFFFLNYVSCRNEIETCAAQKQIIYLYIISIFREMKNKNLYMIDGITH